MSVLLLGTGMRSVSMYMSKGSLPAPGRFETLRGGGFHGGPSSIGSRHKAPDPEGRGPVATHHSGESGMEDAPLCNGT
jgi:hypothetical protein